MHRILTGIGLGGSITFALFAVMSFLIKSEVMPPDSIEQEPIVITMDEINSPVEVRKRILPKKKELPKDPPPPLTQVKRESAKPKVNMVDIKMATLDTGVKDGPYLGETSSGSLSDGDAIPMVVIEPKYPSKPAMEGIEGWVKFKFTIASDGSPKDIEIIDAKPKRMFEREARKAIYKWKFKPRIVDGKAVEQPNMTYTLDFKLAGES